MTLKDITPTTAEQQLTVVDIAGKTTALAIQLGYEGDLTLGSLEDGIRLYQKRTIEDLFELGKRLLLLKEQTPHGDFKKRIEMLSMEYTLASRLMQATLKFSKVGTSQLLKNVNSQSKLLELIVLDDDDINVIESGGSIGDINLDSIETMSVRELKKALRDAKADNDAKDQLIAKKTEKLNELDMQVTKLSNPAAIKKREQTEEQELEGQALKDLSIAGITLLNAVTRFQNDVNSILDLANEKGIPALYDRVDEAVTATYQRIALVSQQLGVQVDFENMVSPAFMHFAASEQPVHEVNSELEN